jgi:hypothetical protein
MEFNISASANRVGNFLSPIPLFGNPLPVVRQAKRVGGKVVLSLQDYDIVAVNLGNQPGLWATNINHIVGCPFLSGVKS